MGFSSRGRYRCSWAGCWIFFFMGPAGRKGSSSAQPSQIISWCPHLDNNGLDHLPHLNANLQLAPRSCHINFLQRALPPCSPNPNFLIKGVVCLNVIEKNHSCSSIAAVLYSPNPCSFVFVAVFSIGHKLKKISTDFFKSSNGEIYVNIS